MPKAAKSTALCTINRVTSVFVMILLFLNLAQSYARCTMISWPAVSCFEHCITVQTCLKSQAMLQHDGLLSLSDCTQAFTEQDEQIHTAP